MYYKGTVALTDGVKALLGGDANAITTEYGDSCTCHVIPSFFSQIQSKANPMQL